MPRSGMAGSRKVLEEEALAQHRFRREFDLERLRAPVRRELRVHGGQRRVAADMGIPRGSLRKFVSMASVPTGGNLEAVESWVADRPEALVTGGMVSLAVLVGDLPAAIRLRARRQLARELGKLYREVGALLPGWLHDELAELQGDDI